MRKHSLAFVALIPISLIVLFSCGQFYKVNKPHHNNLDEKAATVERMKSANKVFILRSGPKAFLMTDMNVSADGKTINSVLTTIPEDQLYHVSFSSDKENTGRRTPPVKKQEWLNQVHLYTDADSAVTYGPQTLDVAKVTKMEIIEYDRGRTNGRVIVGTVAVLGSALVVAGFVALMSSCPFVSAYEGTDFTLQGEIYGGAIYPQLARNDYLPLQMTALKDGSLCLKISNELKERQFTDMAELWVINHPVSSRVFADENGNLHQVQTPASAVKALLNNAKDVTLQVAEPQDGLVVLMNDNSKPSGVNDLDLTFANDAMRTEGKLIITAKNSYFLDLLYGKVAEGLGNQYANYVADKKTKSAASLKKWVAEQNIPLTVSVKEDGEWKQVASLNTIGPLANRQMVVPFKLSGTSSEQVQFRLSCGFFFWEIDEVAIDFSENASMEVDKLSAYSAIDQHGKDVKQQLIEIDKNFLEQPSTGDFTTLSFLPKSPVKAGYTRSFILHANGYYEHIREYKNSPDLKFLSQFKFPGAMSKFGMSWYQQTFYEKVLAQKN